MKKLIYFLFVLGLPSHVFSQVLMTNACESNPCYPIPICGTGTVVQPNSFVSTGNPQAICGSNVFSNNWVYYQLHCYGSGNLKFTITPNDPVSDLNYVLYNTTSMNCTSLMSTTDCNAMSGVGAVSSPFIPLSSGNTYLLGVQRASGGTTQLGFSISFSGTTAMLDDNSHPILDTLLPYNLCSPVTHLTAVMNKPILCAQISANDFTIAGAPSFTAQGVSCPGCVNPTNPNPTNPLINISNFTDTVVFNFSSALTPGFYTIKFNSTSSNLPNDACGHAPQFTDSLNFEIYPTLNLIYQTGFDCSSINYTDTLLASGGNSPYMYKVEGGTQSNTWGSSPIFTGLLGGVIYTLSVKDANGCETTIIHSPLAVLPLQAPNLSLSASPPCHNQFADDSITVIGLTTGVPPYSLTLTSTPANAASSGTFYPPATWKNLSFLTSASFTVIVTDAYGCTSSGVKNLVNPVGMQIALTVIPNACSADSTGVITSNVSGGTPPWIFNYTPTYIPPMVFSNTSSSTINNIVSNVPNGIYTITVTDANGCTETATENMISFNLSPNPIITQVANTLTVQSGFSSYQWYFNMAPISGATGSSYIPTQSGNYSVLVTNANATCSMMSATYVFLPTNLSGTTEQSIQVWPNPVQYNLYLLNVKPGSRVHIRSSDGRIVSSTPVTTSTSEEIDLHTLSSGMYFLIIQNDQETTYRKIYKE